VSKLPMLTGRDVVRALEKAGSAVILIKGSHPFMRHETDPTRQTVVPVHGSEYLGRPLLRKIIKDVGMTVEDSRRWSDPLLQRAVPSH
jgi:predicted RNA binding protein YcfA (HicA-like mRNA interferase family)